eukprot:jgi/Psemu1/180104/e_gw1.13.67.1
MASDGGTATTTAAPADSNNNEESEPIEYNPRWMGYFCILMFSLINFTAISNVPGDLLKNEWSSSMIFGVLTFILSFMILILDRCQSKLGGCLSFNYTKCKGGYLEGSFLGFWMVWWIVGVAYITRPGGIAYTVSNIYFSAWFALASCIYTFNEWSASKDILSIEEIVSVSFTLRYWWIHFVASFVVFLSSTILEVQLGRYRDQSFINEAQDALFGILMGLLSLAVSLFFILVHYDFITCVEEGGWSELFSTVLLIFVWIIALSILTSACGIASTISGFDCLPFFQYETGITEIVKIHNCTITQNGVVAPCRFARYMPGSNLYCACWACMLSSIAIAFKWKAAKALKFAESQAERQQKERDNVGVDEFEGVDDDDDDDDDNDNDDNRQ